MDFQGSFLMVKRRLINFLKVAVFNEYSSRLILHYRLSFKLVKLWMKAISFLSYPCSLLSCMKFYAEVLNTIQKILFYIYNVIKVVYNLLLALN